MLTRASSGIDAIVKAPDIAEPERSGTFGGYRMRYVSLGLGAVAIMLATGAAARDRKVDANPDPDKIICRSEQSIGSRLAKTKRCMTAREWAAEKATNKQDIERIQANRHKNQ